MPGSSTSGRCGRSRTKAADADVHLAHDTFDGIEGELVERLGRRPDIAELVGEYVRRDGTGLHGAMIGFLVRNRVPKFVVYAYMRTTRVLWPFNVDTVTAPERAEWSESMNRYFAVHAPDETRPSKAALDAAWRRAGEQLLSRLAP